MQTNFAEMHDGRGNTCVCHKLSGRDESPLLLFLCAARSDCCFAFARAFVARPVSNCVFAIRIPCSLALAGVTIIRARVLCLPLIVHPLSCLVSPPHLIGLCFLLCDQRVLLCSRVGSDPRNFDQRTPVTMIHTTMLCPPLILDAFCCPCETVSHT